MEPTQGSIGFVCGFRFGGFRIPHARFLPRVGAGGGRGVGGVQNAPHLPPILSETRVLISFSVGKTINCLLLPLYRF